MTPMEVDRWSILGALDVVRKTESLEDITMLKPDQRVLEVASLLTGIARNKLQSKFSHEFHKVS